LALEALRCAWYVHQELAQHNFELPANRQMRFRIGINLDDVIEEEEEIYGDGVNVAARLDSPAEPGGINISGTVYDQVKNKLPYQFEFTGEQTVKNIRDPVRVYRVVMAPDSPTGRRRIATEKRKRSKTAMVLLLFTAVAALGLGFYYWANTHVRSLSESPLVLSLTIKHAI
jgi:adenylate cyclase